MTESNTTTALENVLVSTIERFRADSGTIHLLGHDGHLHLAAASAGLPDQVLATIAKITVGKGMAGLAVERRRPVDACNIQADSSGDVRPGARATGLAGAVVVPIFDGNEVIGALGVANRAERTFTAQEVEGLIEVGREFARLRSSAAAAN
jgi:L-methionine (R)-S-oxide reductase